MDEENNITVTNKRKFINEHDTTLENTLINKHYEYTKREFIKKKQKRLKDKLENINNSKMFGYLKSHKYSVFEEFNDMK